MEKAVENEAIEPQEVEEQVEATTTEEGATSEPEVNAEPEKPAVPAGVQKRIDTITRQRYDAERTIDSLRQELASRPEVKTTEPQDKPKLEDFEYDEGRYIDALTDWKVDLKFQAQATQNAERQQQATKQQTAQDFESKREQVIVNGINKYEDFEAKALNNPNLVVTQDMADVMTESEKGDELLYFLGSNVEEAKRISALSPRQQAVELGKIEAGLTMKPKKRDTKAPEPITPVGSRGSSSSSIDPSKDYRGWAKARNEGRI